MVYDRKLMKLFSWNFRKQILLFQQNSCDVAECQDKCKNNIVGGFRVRREINLFHKCSDITNQFILKWIF